MVADLDSLLLLASSREADLLNCLIAAFEVVGLEGSKFLLVLSEEPVFFSSVSFFCLLLRFGARLLLTQFGGNDDADAIGSCEVLALSLVFKVFFTSTAFASTKKASVK